ncbi:glycine--tRNA ligase subunit beta [Miniphocaeibacter halophilus]|uniref:Glycine--tRNA ligase subunit beta n=1 Tax=Miniphocaeibacter halophilus TaxID=2931922 RepID=A0AC61MPY6_9FIRM|nr:glycine--tRNA ligase subunit beta [Miniphocaeibacter halophilus]QQK07670.1 glycine--tRNA ligase subunit beta [Miniphocaeibacter halophilus]
MDNKVLIEIGIKDLQYNLYDVVIRNLRESLNKNFEINNIKYDELKFNYSKNRILFSFSIPEETNISNDIISKIITDSLNKLFIPIKDLEISYYLKDYIIWIQGMRDDLFLNFNEFNISNEKDSNIKFYKMVSIDGYKELLRKNNIIFENDARRNYFITKSNRMAKEYGGILFDSNYLIEKYINAYNLPYPIIKKFDNKLLEYPQKLLIAILLDICNVFPIVNEKNALMPYFIFPVEKHNINNEIKINNIHLEIINTILEVLSKYEKTMEFDYEYYLNKMKKTKLPLEIGTVYDKTLRIKSFAKILGSYLKVGENTIKNIELEADICKLDLATDIVNEMPALKGIIGYLYAKESGFSDIVSNAMYMYYRPRFYYDKMPDTTSAKILSIADKLDSIANMFIYNTLNLKDNLYQTTDIRRKASGVINIIIENKWDLNLSIIIDDLIYTYIKYNNIVMDYKVLKNEIKSFILSKFREELVNKDFNYNSIDNLIKKYPDNISKIHEILVKGEEDE